MGFYFFWALKRYIWQILLVASLIASVAFAPLMVQGIFAGLLLCRLSLDLWRYFSFKSYSIVDKNAQPKTWESVLQEFSEQKSENIAFYAFSRYEITQRIEKLMKEEKISQSNNNLCGPIAFLNFLKIHHPTLFVKTLCEYAENGCTYAPFYLQSSFWDRYAYFLPVGFVNSFFKNHYVTLGEVLAAAFKNTHNLLGYNNSSLFEVFKGSTEPKKIVEWLAQAGFASSSYVTVNNYANDKEMPWINRFVLCGIYANDEREKQVNNNADLSNVCYINLQQSTGSSPLHFLFNVSSAHWTFSGDKKDSDNCIQIQLRKPAKV